MESLSQVTREILPVALQWSGDETELELQTGAQNRVIPSSCMAPGAGSDCFCMVPDGSGRQLPTAM